MLSFWAMSVSDTDKLHLVLKILLVGFGWASLIIGAIGVIYLVVTYIHEVVQNWKDRRIERLQKAKLSSYNDGLFRNVEEIQNDLR